MPGYALRVLGRKRGTCTWGPAGYSLTAGQVSVPERGIGFLFLSSSEVHLPRLGSSEITELLTPFYS